MEPLQRFALSVLVVVACGLCGRAGPALAADEFTPRPYASLSLGLGYATLERDPSSSTVEFAVQGNALHLDAALGASLAEPLAAHVSVYSAIVMAPRMTRNDARISMGDAELIVGGVGPGFTYRVPVVDLHVSVSGGLGWSVLYLGDRESSTWSDLGYSARAGVHYEFGRVDELALSVGLRGVLARIRDIDGFGGDNDTNRVLAFSGFAGMVYR